MGTDDMTGVVTPEAVRLEFAEADVGSRTVALLIDFMILGVTLWLLNVGIGFLTDRVDTSGIPSWVASTALLLINFTTILGYPVLFETLAHGKTPGKSAMGLRVVTVEGGPVQFRHAAIRAAFWLVDYVLTAGAGAVLATMLSKRHQRLGDMVAGTLVLRERSATPAPEAAVFTPPRGVEDYAASIDPAGLTAAEYDTVRAFLLRAPRMKDEARDRIGRRLMSTLAPKLHHTVPSGVGPMMFLTCLAARYQQRASTVAPGAASIPTPVTAPPEVGGADRSPGDFAPPS